MAKMAEMDWMAVHIPEAFTHNAASGIQVLGATGFILENELNLFLKRAKASEMVLGDPVYHHERVMQLLTK